MLMKQKLSIIRTFQAQNYIESIFYNLNFGMSRMDL